VVDRRDLFGGHDRVMLDHEADAAADPQARRRHRGGGQSHEQVIGVHVFARQLAAACIRRLAAGRDVRVLGEEQRLEAVLLDQARDLPRSGGVMGGEVADAEFHGFTLPVILAGQPRWAARRATPTRVAFRSGSR